MRWVTILQARPASTLCRPPRARGRRINKAVYTVSCQLSSRVMGSASAKILGLWGTGSCPNRVAHLAGTGRADDTHTLSDRPLDDWYRERLSESTKPDCPANQVYHF